MRGALVLFFAASLAATVAAAFPAPANADATAVQRAYLAVRVNGKDVGASLVVLSEGDALVAADVLQNAGVVVPDAAIVLLEGRRYASVKRLDPAATFEVDADAVALNVTLPATRFATQQIDAGDEGTAVPIAHDRSAFLNYAVAKSTSGSVALSGELAATVAGGVADAVLAQSPTGRFTASAYSWTADDLKRKRRLTLGRAIIGETGFSALGSATAIDGVLLEHTRGTNPYWVHQSGAGYAGLASTPSSLEVYVNGVLVQRQDLAPGPFRIENLPLDSGANQTQIVVRDGLGNVRVVRQSLYLDQNLLNRGDRDYTFGAGRLVNAANGAGPLLVSGAYSYGLRSTLTAGLRADVTNGLENVAGRVEAATKLGRIIGLLGLSSAAPNAQLFTAPVYAFVGNVLQLQTPAPNGASSAGGRLQGASYAVSYDYARGGLTLTGAYVAQTASYASLVQSPLQDRALRSVRFSVATLLGRSGVRAAFDFAGFANRDSGGSIQQSLSLGKQLGRNVFASVSAGTQTFAGRSGATFGINIGAYLPRPAISIAASSGSGAGTASTSVSVAHEPPQKAGFAYNVSATSSGPSTALAFDVRNYTPVGDATFFATSAFGSFDGTLQFAGSLAAAGGSVFAGRTITDSFAVIDAGAPGVPVFVNGQRIGTTNRRGRVLAPDLIPFYTNKVAIDPNALPEGASIEEPSVAAIPLPRRGAVVRFGVHQVRAYVTRIVFAQNPASGPWYGRLTLEGVGGATAASDIGADGTVYFDGLAPGTYRGRAAYREGTCGVVLTIPPSKVGVTTLPPVSCTTGGG